MMKNIIKSFAVLAAILSFAACQKEIENPVEPKQELYYVSFVAEEPATKTTVAQATDEEGNKVAIYSWTASDASADRWTVYRGSDVAESVTPLLTDDGVMKITAGFKTASTTGDKFVALFNKGINAVQNITSESVYDPTSDVMISAEVPYEEGVDNYGFRFNRLGAVAKATVKGLTGMETLTDAKLIATDGTILAADYDYSEKAFASAGSTKISVKGIDCDPDANGFFSFYFITVPTESVNIKMLVSALDDQAEEHLFVKQLGKAIGFEKGNVHAFNVSGFAEVTTKANFNVNGNVTSKPIYQREPVEFPQNPDPINGYDFVGWSTSEITGTQQEEPEMVDVETEVMGDADVTYYAVFAKITEPGTATNTITYGTTNIPTSYGDADDITLNGVVFNVTQMYKSGEKMQWRAAGNKNGTGTMYNKDAITSIQSIALTYHEDDTNRNFTVKVGNSANPTDGTDISASQVDETATYVYDCSTISPSYFVLTNGDGAGYLTSIVITYLDGEPIYSDYCTSIDTRIVTTLSWSAPTATVKLNGDDNEFPTLTADPEEVAAGVEYSSSNTEVATIDDNGNITLKAVGETTITAAFPEGDEDYQPSSASYTLVVTAPAKHTVTFSISGQTSTQEFDENDLVEFPEVSEIDGVVFRGWSKNTISGTQLDAPEMVNTEEETMGNADITYYAVFAKETKASTYTDSKLSSNSFKSNSTYVLAAAESSSATTLHYFSSYTGTTSNESWGVTSTTADDAISFTLSGTADALVAKDASGNYLQALATGKFRMSSSSTTLTLKDDGTIYNPNSGSTGYNLRYNHNNGSGGFRWYNGATGTSAYFYERVADITYSNYCTTVITLSSVEVSGTPSTTSYKVGESFDVDGLVATAVYSDGGRKTVTEDVEWTVTPAGALAAGTTSVSVVAKYGKVSSEAKTVNITVINVTFDGISIKTAPAKVNYTEGDMFDPTGLVISKNYSDESVEEVAYSGNESDFTFNPTTSTALTTSVTSVTITYSGKSVSQAITVNEKPALETMDAIFAAATEAGSNAKDAKVKFDSWVVSGVKNNNAYLTDNNGKGLIIYTSGHGFAVGDILNGTVNCKVQLYKGAAELTSLTSTTEGLTVTKGGTITPATIAIANLSGVNTGAVITFESLQYNGTDFTDGANTIKPFNTFISLPTLIYGRSYSVTGVYIQYDSTKEIAPRTENDIVEKDAPKYAVNVGEGITNGTVTVDCSEATEGQTVTITATPSSGYKVKSVSAKKTASGDALTVTNNKFTMPAEAVTVSAEFEEAGQGGGTTYTKVTSAPTDWSGTYILVYDGKACNAGDDEASNYTEVSDVNGIITGEYADCEVEIAKYSTGYSIKALGGNNKGKFLEGKGSSNGTTFAASASKVTTLSISDGVVTITNNTNVFVYNSAANNLRWRFFKSTTASSSGYYKPTLYKKN